MGLKDFFSEVSKYLTGEALIGATQAIKETVDSTTAKVIKASALYVMFVIGLLFFLIGLAQFLQAYNYWIEGLGFAVVGLGLILLGFVVKALR